MVQSRVLVGGPVAGGNPSPAGSLTYLACRQQEGSPQVPTEANAARSGVLCTAC